MLSRISKYVVNGLIQRRARTERMIVHGKSRVYSHFPNGGASRTALERAARLRNTHVCSEPFRTSLVCSFEMWHTHAESSTLWLVVSRAHDSAESLYYHVVSRIRLGDRDKTCQWTKSIIKIVSAIIGSISRYVRLSERFHYFTRWYSLGRKISIKLN